MPSLWRNFLADTTNPLYIDDKDQFHWIFEEVEKNINGLCRMSGHAPVVIQIVNAPEYKISTDGHVINMNIGAYLLLERLLSYWQVKKEKGELVPVSGSLRDYRAYDRWVSPGGEGQQRVKHLLLWALTFICIHELGHIFDQHVQDKDVGGIKMIQAKEFYADGTAVELTTYLIQKQGKQLVWNDISINHFMGLVYLLFRLDFFIGDNWVEQLWKKDHPIGQFRFLVFREVYYQMTRIDLPFAFPIDTVDQGARRAESLSLDIGQGLNANTQAEWDALVDHLNTSNDVQELIRLLVERWLTRAKQLPPE